LTWKNSKWKEDVLLPWTQWRRLVCNVFWHQMHAIFLTPYLILHFNSVFVFLMVLALNSGPTLWATPPALFCDGFFLRYDLTNYLPRLVSNHNPPDLCLLSN
jgi:hypothetical protein